MVWGTVMLRKVVGFICSTALPVDDELALWYPVPNPVETNFHRFGTFLFDRVIGDASCGEIVRDEVGVGGCGWPSARRHVRWGHAALPLWKRVPNSASAALDMMCSMIWHGTSMAPLWVGGGFIRVRCLGWVFGHVTQVVVSGKAESALRFRQVRRVSIDVEYHGAGAELDDGIRVRGAIVEELGHGGDECLLGGRGLTGRQGAQGHEHSAVNGTRIVQESSDDFLYALFVMEVDERGLIVSCVLDVGPVGAGCIPWVWRVLWACR
jgi:hypothetical protein